MADVKKPPSGKPNRDWKTPARIAGFSILGALTVYMGVVTLLWSGAISDLLTTHSNLTAEIGDSENDVEQLRRTLHNAEESLDIVQDDIIDSADTKAHTQDHADGFATYTLHLKDCAEVREEQIYHVKRRHLYTLGSQRDLIEWEAEINTYCDGVSSDLVELLAEEDAL